MALSKNFARLDSVTKASRKVAYNVTMPSAKLGFLLGIIFVFLKITNVITWSWVWVTAPFWLPWAFVAGFITLIFGFILLCLIFMFVVALLLAVCGK